MWGKKISTHTDWAPKKGVKFLKKEVEERDIWAANVLPLCKKGEIVQPCIEKIQNALHDLQKRLLNEACRALFSPQEISWWQDFLKSKNVGMRRRWCKI
jgi:hypothetical protein